MINKDLKVAVLGAGAMGCLFGGLLAEKGLNVILIDVWKEHVDAINKEGLKIWYERAAAFPATFYGQLALKKLDRELFLPSQSIEFNQDEFKKFKEDELVRALILLLQVENRKLF